MTAGLLGAPLRAIVAHRDLLARTVADDVRQRYAGLAAGRAWVVLSPLALMAFYAVVYVLIFRIRPAALTPTEYVLYIFAGLMPFLGFVEALNAGTTSLSANRLILLNTVFPAELVPLRAVLASQPATLVALGVVLAGAVAVGRGSPALLLAPVLVVLLVMFVTGVVWLLSLANLVLRDVQPALGLVTMALLIVSPISYTPDMVPPSLSFLLYLNPMSYFVLSFQHVVVLGRLPALPVLAVAVALGVLSFGLGFQVFRRVKQVLFDHA